MTNHVISGTTITYGPPGALYGGQSIGYSFETLNENLLKHRGYHVQAALQLPCEQQNYTYLTNPAAWPLLFASYSQQNHSIIHQMKDHEKVQNAGCKFTRTGRSRLGEGAV